MSAATYNMTVTFNNNDMQNIKFSFCSRYDIHQLKSYGVSFFFLIFLDVFFVVVLLSRLITIILHDSILFVWYVEGSFASTFLHLHNIRCFSALFLCFSSIFTINEYLVRACTWNLLYYRWFQCHP